MSLYASYVIRVLLEVEGYFGVLFVLFFSSITSNALYIRNVW